MKKILMLAIVLGLALSPTVLTVAQDDVLVDGLNAPRGITFDGDGNLWIVEAGQGGDLTDEAAFGDVAVGGTGALKMLSADDGDLEIVVQNLPSMGPAGSARGAQDVIITDDAIWLLIGQTTETLSLGHSILELDSELLRIQTYVDLFTMEAVENPDGDLVDSNPTGFIVDDSGRFYVANAGCNCVQTWADGEEVSAFVSWTDNTVPTTVAFDPDGNILVSFLTAFPFPQGSSTIDRYSPDGELINTIEGLTSVVDMLVTDDGTIYAVEHGVFGDQGWETGRVVRVDSDGSITEVMGDLTRPWGIAMNPDGDLAVVEDSISDNGRVRIISMN